MDVRQPFAFFPREHKHKYWKNNLRRFPGIAAQATFMYTKFLRNLAWMKNMTCLTDERCDKSDKWCHVLQMVFIIHCTARLGCLASSYFTFKRLFEHFRIASLGLGSVTQSAIVSLFTLFKTFFKV